MTAVEFRDVSIVFGPQPQKALALADAGHDPAEINRRTGSTLGVSGCSLSVEQGEVCVLMGLSGSGKSTLLRAVNGLNRITRGQMLVTHNGRTIDVASCGPRELRQLRMSGIAMVFQQFGLLPWRTVAENVGLGLELRGMSRHRREAIVMEKLALVGLAQWKDNYIPELSGGMQQRVGLARAFAIDVGILLMDEPFSALDPLIRSHLQDELLELQRGLRKTIIFVSHDLDEAIKIGSHIAIMESGRIVQYGRPEDIVLRPANRYVADFVAHMNPLQVLRCASLMTPVDKLESAGNAVLLDALGQTHVALNADGTISGVTVGGDMCEVVDCPSDADLEKLNRRTIAVAGAGSRMREAIEMRYRTGHPVIVVHENKMIGMIGDNEIYRAVLRQNNAAKKLNEID